MPTKSRECRGSTRLLRLIPALAAACAVSYIFILMTGIKHRELRFHPASLEPDTQQLTYAGHAVLRYSPRTESEHFRILRVANDLGLDIWSAVNDRVDVRVAPADTPTLLHHSLLSGIPYHVFIDDVQEAILRSKVVDPKHDEEDGDDDDDDSIPEFFRDFQSVETIAAFVQSLVAKFPNNTRLVPIGTTPESRTSHALVLSNSTLPDSASATDPASSRPSILIVGGQHAREFISISTTSYLAYQLLELQAASDAAIHRLFATFDIHIIYLANPDGYAFARNSDRMWRKSRQHLVNHPECVGVDINKSFSTFWRGAANPCSDTYPGAEAFSAPEARAIADYATSIPRLEAFINLHSYSQVWMYPYAATCDEMPPHYENLVEAALGAASAARIRTGMRYGTGAGCELLSRATGSAMDWMYVERGVRYSFYVELRDLGEYGFLVPPTLIVPTGDETLASLVFLADFIRERERL